MVYDEQYKYMWMYDDIITTKSVGFSSTSQHIIPLVTIGHTWISNMYPRKMLWRALKQAVLLTPNIQCQHMEEQNSVCIILQKKISQIQTERHFLECMYPPWQLIMAQACSHYIQSWTQYSYNCSHLATIKVPGSSSWSGTPWNWTFFFC